MKFYRTFMPFKAISFDLDDTLYDNRQVIQNAENQFVAKLSELLGQGVSIDEWKQWKFKILAQDPVLCEDVTQWRFEAVRAFLLNRGKSAVEIETIWQTAIEHFFVWRHKIAIPAQSFSVLKQLKQHYPLIAITNGNVSPERIGLDFDLTLKAGVHGRAKPHQALFHQAAAVFHLHPQDILHVGDNLVTDVQGAIQAGCQSVWINLSDLGIGKFAEARLLPTVEIADLTELLSLTK
ncbi:HAD-IA family hydrolase [Actinobacillus porcinus]|uniref:HAD-IA family hydrolase n=1 Tax=Actinobacillus porcinus TaxID=51048 RepID=UPI002354863E|nr:HAD-IA family hydrolase [Actinobacillus porcinus]MCI5763113.1 HAD-IA family hydrolase [Actinobacillus porcinus]MDY5420676.1 HAD-IA family hydrolase [Actinobacillus porcinus]